MAAAAAALRGPVGSSLRRAEFVQACEALLADSPGCASATDLHDLFDVLDPRCTGCVDLPDFARLLRSNRQPAGAPQPPFRVGHDASAGQSPLAGLRAFMLQHDWLLQDLLMPLGGPQQRLARKAFEDKLLARVRTPWLTQQGVGEIFTSLRSGQDSLVVADLVDALLDCASFAEAVAARTVRVVFQQAHQRKLDVGQLCLAADSRRTGLLSRAQLKGVVDGICPNFLAEADVGLLFARFCEGGASFRYERLTQALAAERKAYREHLLYRGWPALERQAAAFEEAALAKDAARSGALTSAQLAGVWRGLDLPGFSDHELADFTELLRLAAGQSNPEAFKYAALAKDGKWTLSLEQALAKVSGGTAAAAAGKAPPKSQYLLTILFYKTAQSAKSLGLTAEQAFERLDRGGRGFLGAEDLRLAVRDVHGRDELLADLGLKADDRLFFPEFRKRIDFDTSQLAKHLEAVFGDAAAVGEGDFRSLLAKHGVDTVTAQNWLQLMYPAGVPAGGVQRRCCDTLLATTPAASLARPPGRQGAPELRRLLKEQAGPDQAVPRWLPRADAEKLLSEKWAKAEVSRVLDLVASASDFYPGPPGADAAEEVCMLRTETLLACTEAGVEHVLEVHLKSISGLAAVVPKPSEGDPPPDVFVRYQCHGTQCVAETGALDAAKDAADLDLRATHAFGLSSADDLADLFGGRAWGLSVEVWAMASGEPRRLLATAFLTGSDQEDFLKAAAGVSQKPEALQVLGSKRDFKLQLRKGPSPTGAAVANGQVAVTLRYSKRSPAEAGALPLPWNSSFSGRLVVRRSVAEDMELSEEPKPKPKAKAKPPPEGTAKIEVKLGRLEVKSGALRKLVARCLEGHCAADGSPAAAVKGGLGVFLRLQLPARGSSALGASALHSAGRSWTQTPVSKLPDFVSAPALGLAAVEALTFPDLGGFAWASDPMDSGEAVEALGGVASLELWLRMECFAGGGQRAGAKKVFADVRLAENSLQLKELLAAISPEEPGVQRLRVLCDGAIKPVVAFKLDEEPLAELQTEVSLKLLNGPSMVSWLLPAPKKPEPKKVLVDYTLVPREVLLSRDFEERLAAEDRRGQPRRDPRAEQAGCFYYMEVGKRGGTEGPGAGRPCYRSAPVQGAPDSSGWLRLPCPDDARLQLPSLPAIGNDKASDAEVARGDHHGVSVRLLQLARGGGARLVAEAQVRLPVGEVAEGVPSAAFFGGHLWLPLYHAALDSPSLAMVGRVLVSVEAERPASAKDQKPRLMKALPAMPSGIFLPLYEAWSPAPAGDGGPWALEATLREFAGGGVCGGKLSATSGLPPEKFEQELEASGHQPELPFLRSAVPQLFLAKDTPVPCAPLLHWMALRQLARVVLPCADRLLRRLQQQDGARSRSPSGTVAPVALREALHGEVPEAARLPAALWALLAQRPQWSPGGSQFGSREYFDYLVFFRDLELAGSDSRPALPPAGSDSRPALLPAGAPERLGGPRSDGPAVQLSVSGALHLPLFSGAAPTTFASYQWVRGAAGSPAPPASCDGHLGRTEVKAGTRSPSWDHTAELGLPELSRPYPEAFGDLILELHVWHVVERSGEQILVGTASVDLAPLRSGFAQVDGYFHIGGAEGESSGSRGQIRVAVVPRWSQDTLRVVPRAGTAAPTPAAIQEPSPRGLRAQDPAAAWTLWKSPALEASAGATWADVRAAELPRAAVGSPAASPVASETALRMASYMSETELRLRTLEGTADQQLEELRKRHRENLASLDRLQHGMLPPMDPARLLLGAADALGASSGGDPCGSSAAAGPRPGEGVGPTPGSPAARMSRMSGSPAATSSGPLPLPQGAAAGGPAPAREPSPSLGLDLRPPAAALPTLGGALLPLPQRSADDLNALLLAGPSREETLASIGRALSGGAGSVARAGSGDVAAASRESLLATIGRAVAERPVLEFRGPGPEN